MSATLVDPTALAPVTPDVPGVRLLEAADISLSSGQPQAPLTLVYRLDEPLPADAVLYVVHDGAQSADVLAAADGTSELLPSEVLAAEMSPDRLAGTVTLSHLSLVEWWVGFAESATALIGRFTGQRTDPPDCPDPYPAWMTQLPVFLDDQNAPMRICVERDPNDADIAVVKIANNRGGVMRITSPVTPSWAYQSMFGPDAKSWMNDLAAQALTALGATADERSRGWLLPPGAQLHMGFSQEAVAGQNPLVVRGRLPLAGAVGGTVYSLIDAVPTRDIVALGMYGVCLQSGSAAAADNPDLTGLAQAAAQMYGCIIDDPDHVVRYLKGKIPAAQWSSLKDAIGPVLSGTVRKLNLALALGEQVFVSLDLAATYGLQLHRRSLDDHPLPPAGEGRPAGRRQPGHLRRPSPTGRERSTCPTTTGQGRSACRSDRPTTPPPPEGPLTGDLAVDQWSCAGLWDETSHDDTTVTATLAWNDAGCGDPLTISLRLDNADQLLVEGSSWSAILQRAND